MNANCKKSTVKKTGGIMRDQPKAKWTTISTIYVTDTRRNAQGCLAGIGDIAGAVYFNSRRARFLKNKSYEYDCKKLFHHWNVPVVAVDVLLSLTRPRTTHFLALCNPVFPGEDDDSALLTKSPTHNPHCHEC